MDAYKLDINLAHPNYIQEFTKLEVHSTNSEYVMIAINSFSNLQSHSLRWFAYSLQSHPQKLVGM